MIDLQVQASFPGFDNFARNVQDAMGLTVQLAAPVVQEIAREEVILSDAFDTYALQESIYIAWFGGTDYDERCAEAEDAALNNPTKWPDIRDFKLNGAVGGNADGSGGGLIGGGMDLVELDPPVTSESRYDAWVAVAAAHGKYVENGYISWYGNWVPARPFWEATVQRAMPVVIEMLRLAMYNAMQGRTV